MNTQEINEYYSKLRERIANCLEFHYQDTDSMTFYYSNYHKLRIVLYPVGEDIYNLSVQEFLKIVDDAETNGIEVHYIGGKLYYSYII